MYLLVFITEHVAVGIYNRTCSCWYLLLNMQLLVFITEHVAVGIYY